MKLNLLTFCVAVSTPFFVMCNGSKNKLDKAEYSGRDVTNRAVILRDKDTKAASVQINGDGKWTLYAGTSVENINFSQPVAEGSKAGEFPLQVPDSVRSYFQLVTPERNAILAERHLPMKGGFNFRDLGGYKTKEGKYVKWGKIFRSDDLPNLTDADLKYLATVPVVSIVDFRSAGEIEAAPDKNPPSLNKNYPYSINPGNLMQAMSVNDLSARHFDSLMMEMNRLLVSDTAVISQYRKFFALLQNDKDIPLMFHCTAGKDRTGMGAALILSALGVDEDTIFEDYLLSNKYLAEKYRHYIEQNPELEPLFVVKPEFLKAGFDEIKNRYGSVENYLTGTLNVDLDKMKRMYLY